MPHVTSSPPSLRPMMARIQAEAQRKKMQAVLALAEAVDAGTIALQDALEAAHTKTGLRREAEGDGFPGRHLTGQMVGSISNNTHAPEFDGERTVMALGWFPGEFQDYFLQQDLGVSGMIPAANGMFAAQEESNAVMRALMAEWEAGDLEFND